MIGPLAPLGHLTPSLHRSLRPDTWASFRSSHEPGSGPSQCGALAFPSAWKNLLPGLPGLLSPSMQVCLNVMSLTFV